MALTRPRGVKTLLSMIAFAFLYLARSVEGLALLKLLIRALICGLACIAR
jgi:hypothetical protein